MKFQDLCSTPPADAIEIENFEEEASNMDTPSASNENATYETGRGSQETVKLKPNRKRQADEELIVIKGLAQSITERTAKAQRMEKSANSQVDSFCQYVSHTLSELDPRVQHLAQHKISQVLFQAQTGSLTVKSLYGFMASNQPQPQFFHSNSIQYGLSGMSSRPVSTNFKFERQHASSSNNE